MARASLRPSSPASPARTGWWSTRTSSTGPISAAAPVRRSGAPISTARARTTASSPAPAPLPGVAVDADHVFWTNFGLTTIGRADLGGTNVEPELHLRCQRPGRGGGRSALRELLDQREWSETGHRFQLEPGARPRPGEDACIDLAGTYTVTLGRSRRRGRLDHRRLPHRRRIQRNADPEDPRREQHRGHHLDGRSRATMTTRSPQRQDRHRLRELLTTARPRDSCGPASGRSSTTEPSRSAQWSRGHRAARRQYDEREHRDDPGERQRRLHSGNAGRRR